MFNFHSGRGVFLALPAAVFLTVAGCSNQATDQSTNQTSSPQKAAAAKPAGKPAAPKPVAKKPDAGKAVAAKAPAPKPPAASKTASSKTASTRTVYSAKPVSSKVAANKTTAQINFVTIPQGTAVRATISQALASNKNHSGDSFAGVLSAPVKVDGKIVIPKGAHVAGRIVTAKKAGPAELTFALTSVKLDGKSYKLATEPVNRSGKAPAKEGEADSTKPEKDITVAAQSHLKFKLAKSTKIPAKS